MERWSFVARYKFSFTGCYAGDDGWRFFVDDKNLAGVKLRGLTEGALLAAMSVILALAAVYLPVLGSFAAVFWALPLMVTTRRHGLKLGIMGTVTATAVMALIIEPLIALKMLISFAPTGLCLGYGFRQNFSSVKIIGFTIVASTLAKIAALLLVFFVTDINPFTFEGQAMKSAVADVLTLYSQAGVDAEQIASTEAEAEKMLEMLGMLMPLIIALLGVLDACSNYMIAKLVLMRLNYEVPSLPDVADWHLPQVFLLLFGFSLVGLYWGSTREIDLLYRVSVNVNMLTMLSGAIQGFALIFALTRHFKVSKFVRAAIVFLFIINGLLFQTLAFVGLFDMYFDYRKRFSKFQGF